MAAIDNTAPLPGSRPPTNKITGAAAKLNTGMSQAHSISRPPPIPAHRGGAPTIPQRHGGKPTILHYPGGSSTIPHHYGGKPTIPSP